jgi:hypothetical protein
MKSITLDKFDIGIDHRKGASVSDPSRMRVLRNAYVTIGKVLRKRPGIELVETFTGSEAGTVGLVAGNGKLNTFIEGVAAGHANTLFKMNRVAHPTTVQDVTAVDVGDVFDGNLYLSAVYPDGSRHHHYLDIDDETEYASRSWQVGEYARGSASDTNGLRMRCSVATPAVALASPFSSVAGNTLLTTAAAHTLSVGDIAVIYGVVGGTFISHDIDEIPAGQTCQIILDPTVTHTYVAGDYVLIAGVTDGAYSVEINAVHEILSVGDDSLEIDVEVYEAGSTGRVGVVTINGEHEVLTVPSTTTFTIAAECTVAATAGNVRKTSGTEPTWPSLVGNTTLCGDGVTEFTAESTYISDPDCPNSKSFTKAASKIWATDDNVIRACSVARPRIWNATLRNNPGVILPVSSHARGSSNTTAVAQYDGRLSVFFADSVQFWDVDPDPSKDAYYKSVEGVGTEFPLTPKEFAGDVVFLAASGIRSVTTLQYGNQNLAENDIGSAIDELVKPQTSLLIDPVSEFYTRAGQYWCLMKEVPEQPVWAFTFSRTQKISAWAEYRFIKSDGADGTVPLDIDAVAVVGSDLYLRSGESIYKVNSNDSVFDDNGVDYEMRIEFPFLDFKAPGSTKYIASMDVVFQGSCDVQFKFDPNDESFITDKIRLTGDTRQKASIPLEITAASIAPVFTDTSGNDVQIEAITFYYEDLGPISG